jgi:DNA invertase Pin-like site-specific DNA recombinase
MKKKQELVDQIRQMAKKQIPTKEIAKVLGISSTTVLYWVNDEYREKTKKRSNKISTQLYREGKLWADKNPEKYRKWFREYQRKRYENDPDFRLKIKTANRERMARLRAEKKGI